MLKERKGFTLIEIVVALVILAILAAIMIPAMTGWIDKSKEKRLIAACRTCVIAAQTLASEAYRSNTSTTPPEGDSVVALAGVDGIVSSISLDSASAAVNTLTYSEGAESVTYLRLPSPQYIFGLGITGEVAAASTWAQSYQPAKASEAKELLTIQYASQNPNALTPAQIAEVFGGLVPADDTQYVYPMAIYDTYGNRLNIQYVTPQNPAITSSQNRYQASAFIIDGKTYLSASRQNDKVVAQMFAKAGKDPANRYYSFQNIMNHYTFESTQAFLDFITEDGYYTEAK